MWGWASGSVRQDYGGNPVLATPGSEDLGRKTGYLRLVRRLSPVDQIVRLVQLQRAEQLPAQLRPDLIMVIGVNHRLECAQPDVIAAALVAQNMAPAADLDSPALRRLSIATGARAEIGHGLRGRPHFRRPFQPRGHPVRR